MYLCHEAVSFGDLVIIFFIARPLTRDIDIAILSVRDVPVSDENGLTYCHGFFTIW